MMVPLCIIREIAPSLGLPTHKSSLMKSLEKAGAVCHHARVDRGQTGKVYDVDTLPAVLQNALARSLSVALRDIPPTKPFDHFETASPGAKDEAIRRLGLVRKVEALKSKGLTQTAATAEVAADTGVPSGTLRTYCRKVRNLEWGDWHAALVPDWKGGTPNDIDPRVTNAFLADYGRPEQPQAQACYERLLKKAGANGWTVPSLKTLQRRFSALPASEKVLLREGEAALKALYPHQERDRSGMRALDSLNVDSRIWDVMVQHPDGHRFRPVVTVIQDEASNAVLAWEITETESGQSFRRVIRAACSYGLPDLVRFDNTMAAANKAITAGARGRFRFAARPDDVPGLLPRLGIEVRFTQPYNGRAKLVERAFAELKERSEKDPRLAGAYTGRSPAEKPANYGESAASLPLFAQVLTEAFEHFNHRTDRRSKVAHRTSYMAVFEESLKARPVRKLTAEQDRIFFYATKVVTPTKSGEFFLGTQPYRHRYYNVAIQDFAYRNPGQPIVVRYDENNLAAPIVVEAVDGREIAGSVERIEAGPFDSVEHAKQHARAEREARKATKLSVRQSVLADRMLAGDVLPAVVGSIAPQQLPETPIVQLTPGKRPRGAAMSAKEPIFPERDPLKLAEAEERLRETVLALRAG